MDNILNGFHSLEILLFLSKKFFKGWNRCFADLEFKKDSPNIIKGFVDFMIS